jgi:hypothetical protein
LFRRPHPGISFDTARALIAESAAGTARLEEDLAGRIAASAWPAASSG